MAKNVSHLKISVIVPTLFPIREIRLRKVLFSVKLAAERISGLSNESVIVINGCSTAQIAKVKFPKEFRYSMISSVENRGFAQSVNDGILHTRASKPDWYLILNDDAYLDEAYFLLIEHALRSKKIDAISEKIFSTSGKVESVGLRYFSTGLAFPRRENIYPDELSLFSGTCVMLSRTRVEKELLRNGYVFNPLFFAYAEDLELSLRIHRDGGGISINNEASVTHEGSQTAKRGSYFQLYHGYRNLVLVVLLLWNRNTILRRLPLLLIGQLYIIAMSIYKGYWLLYPKLWWWIVRHRSIIVWQRRMYGTK